MMKIDAVITWVDGDDPAHQAKRLQYGSKSLFKVGNIAGSTRFTSVGEIFWCVASLNRFAPWINRIYIVTDNQDPGLDDFLAKNFPEGHIPYEIVDHKVIFRGYEEYLPTFNSIAIETMTWRIPGLSDHFIEFNDDLLLVSPTTPDDFFGPDGSPVCYYIRYNMLWVRLKNLFRPKKHGHSNVTFKGTMANGAMIAGERFRFIKLHHTPHSLRRDWYESFYTAHPELMLRNIRYRFRDVDQFSSEVMQYSFLRKSGRLIRRPFIGNLFYLTPKDKPNYVARRMRRLERHKFIYACFNSVDKASPGDLSRIKSWISRRLQIALP